MVSRLDCVLGLRLICVGLAAVFVFVGCGQQAAPPSESTPPQTMDTSEPAPEQADTAEPVSAEPAVAPAGMADASGDAKVVAFTPGPEVQGAIQEALILAEPGTVFQFEEGTFEFTMQLSVDVDGVTLRGRGMDKTILSFKNQDVGTEGLYVTSDNVTLEDFAIEDTKGNCHKSNGADNHVIRRVRAEWTGGPKETNGGYGLYPVSSKNVLIEECIAIGASDSGIYVGQSENVVVRKCVAEYNVAGIEIENCHGAEVTECVATHNAGGILVFDLPDLPVQRGRDIRVYRNKVINNDTENFAPKGNIVATVPTGTGVMVMANSNVEVFENVISGNATTNVLLTSYLSTLREIKDPNYYPYPEGIHIHSNTFGECGGKPGGDTGALLAGLVGTPLPDILWDGIVNDSKLVDGVLPAELGIYIRNNTKESGELTFANMDAAKALSDPASAEVKRDLAAHDGSLPPVAPVVLEGLS